VETLDRGFILRVVERIAEVLTVYLIIQGVISRSVAVGVLALIAATVSWACSYFRQREKHYQREKGRNLIPVMVAGFAVTLVLGLLSLMLDDALVLGGAVTALCFSLTLASAVGRIERA